jgi:putative phosphoribosyl transferase
MRTLHPAPTAGTPFIIKGKLSLPAQPLGVVLFAHASDSSSNSPRHPFVASELFKANLGTLLFDLLTEEETSHPVNAFEIALLANRLRQATDWVAGHAGTAGLPIGYLATGTGAAAAMLAAETDARVKAIVCRSGRPDLAGDPVCMVSIPTLLIVGGDDPETLKLNSNALSALGAQSNLCVVPRATHRFDEPGTLARVAQEAAAWFARYLPTHGSAP